MHSVGSASLSSARSISSAATGTRRYVEPSPRMKEGMRKLLEMHNADELKYLAEDLGLEGNYTKEQRIDEIFRTQFGEGEVSYMKVLAKVWEGILIEYWRSLGKKIGSYKTNVRTMIMRFWSEREEEGPETVYQPHFAPSLTLGETEKLLHEGVTTEDEEKIRAFLDELAIREEELKVCERRIRLGRDFDAIMDYFSALSSVRQLEAQGRNRLIADVHLSQKYLLEAQARMMKAEQTKLEAEKRMIDEKNARLASESKLRKQVDRLEFLERFRGKADVEISNLKEELQRATAKVNEYEKREKEMQAKEVQLEEAMAQAEAQKAVMQRLRERVAELEGKEQATEASAKEWADKEDTLLTHLVAQEMAGETLAELLFENARVAEGYEGDLEWLIATQKKYVAQHGESEPASRKDLGLPPRNTFRRSGGATKGGGGGGSIMGKVKQLQRGGATN